MTGYTDVIGENCRLLQGDGTDPETRAPIREAIDAGRPVSVDIEDNGPGIPEQELEVLQEGETPLRHADRLGLWFIYWVVSRVGGDFTITERDPQGTELRLSVPPSVETER